MPTANRGRRRPASTILIAAAAAASALMLIGTTSPSASAQITRAAIAQPPAVQSPAVRSPAASPLRVNAALQHQFLTLYAASRHIPVADVGRASPGSVKAAETSNGTDWATVHFLPAQNAPLTVRVQFQDGNGIALFTRTPAKEWRLASLGGQPLGCDSAVPAAIRRLWGASSCPASAPRTVTPRSITSHSLNVAAESGTTADIATVAENEVGVSDNPSESNFGGLDCNPFTAFENPSASDSGCGTDSHFGVEDHSELWCSDFAKWVWAQAGVTSDMSTLTPLSSSFYAWGLAHGESMPVDGGTPEVGDAIVLYPSGTSGTTALEDDGDHVGVVTGVNSNGTIDVVNGDFIWGSATTIQVVEVDNISAATFAADAEGSGEEWVYVSPQLPTESATPLASSPVTTFGQQLEVFGRAANDQAYSDAWTPEKGWSGWGSIEGGLDTDPTATEYDTSNYGQQMEVFGQDSGVTYSNVWTQGSGWSGWMNLGGGIIGQSVAIQYGTQMQVFGVAANGQTYSDVYTPGKTWSGWGSIGGDIVGEPSVVNYGGQLEVFGRAANGQTYSDVYTPGKSWSGWGSIGGDIVGNPVAVQYGTQMQVFGRAANGQTYSDVWTPGKSWSGWVSIGGGLDTDPSVAEYDTSNYGQQLEVYGADNGVTYGNVWTQGSGWSGWISLGGDIVGNPVAVQYGTQMQVFGRAANGQTYSDVYTPGKSWSGWGSIEGDLLP